VPLDVGPDTLPDQKTGPLIADDNVLQERIVERQQPRIVFDVLPPSTDDDADAPETSNDDDAPTLPEVPGIEIDTSRVRTKRLPAEDAEADSDEDANPM